MSYNFLDKTGLAYFWSKIKAKIPTKTSQLTNDSHLSYSIEKPSGTIDDLAAFTSGKPGITGSISLVKKSSGIGSEIPAGWYNFFFSPHRTGSGGDNTNYGTILLTPMNFAGASWILRRSNSTTVISEVKKITTADQLSNYIVNSNSYINTHPENSPVLIPFMHNDIAFLLKRGGSIKAYYDDVEKTLSNQDAMFDACPNYWVQNPTGITKIVLELTLHKVFTWSNTIYCDFGSAGWRAKNVKIEVMNTNYPQDVWTVKGNATGNSYGNVKVTFNHTPVGASNAGGGFNKIRFTFSDWATATIFRIAQLGVYNYGSLGLRETSMSRGTDDYVFRNITPNSNNTYNLGDSSHKWANVYATTFQGNATSATKATQDSDGNQINTTYYKASNPNGYTSNTGTITGIKMNGASKGTSGVVDLGTVITAHQDISGKQDKLTAGTGITIDSNNVISASSGDYIIEFPSSWSSVISEYEQAGSPDDFEVDILYTTYSGIDSDHEHYFVNADLYSAIDRLMYGDIAEAKLNLNNTTYDNNYYVSSAYISADGDTQLDILFNDSAYVVSQDLGWLSISGKYIASAVPYYRISCGPADLTYFYNNAEFTNNKVTSISSSSTNTQYPSALAVYNYVNSAGGGGIESSNNTIENIVSLTKAEYNALQTKETKTLYNITDDVTEPSVTRGSATANSTYISAVENNHWERIGKVVSYSFTMTAGGTWTTNNMFASGLPKPVAALRFVGINHNKNVPMRFQLTADGQLGNAWSGTTPVSGNQLEGQVTYITNDP